MNDFAVRVFPSSSSNEIRRSGAVIHYAPEPPIDYTVKEKPKAKATSYGHVTSIPWKPALHSAYVPPHSGERQRSILQQDVRRAASPRRATAGSGPAPLGGRRDTEMETALILEDLDHLLDTEELTLEQRMTRLEMNYGRSLPHTVPIRMQDREGNDFPRIPVKTNFLPRNGHAVRSSPLPLRRTNENSKSRGLTRSDNTDRRSSVAEMYKETERKIEEAIRFYTPDYFRQRKFSSPTLPPWKSELLARKESSETIRRIEEEAWAEFAEWKRQYAPSVTVHPTWRHKRQPVLP